jgi:hypothetical protein
LVRGGTRILRVSSRAGTPVALHRSIRAFDKESFRAILKWFDGTWRSLVARTLGVREVASSNLAVPTNKKRGFPIFRRKAFQFFVAIAPFLTVGFLPR